ncbi:SCO4225 family membrane protein [Streptomyces axinellae]|uniref:Integral membrane protein n=1 Tax=Streptomyces axinellae TaxID=552788 RepID=A0ABN3PWW8_9ACTN
MTRTYNWGMTARRLWGNPAALGYLALVLGTVAFTLVTMGFAPEPDASMAGVWMYVATAPVSFLFVMAGSVETWFMVFSLVVSALVQSAVIGALYSALRARRQESPRRPSLI